MKTTLAILAATTALGTIIALPAVGAFGTTGMSDIQPSMADTIDPIAGGALMLASDDDDEDERSARYLSIDDDDDDGCEDDDDGGCGPDADPAPAGAVDPPANGLFGNGSGPKVQVN